jgi:hypothetical protein
VGRVKRGRTLTLREIPKSRCINDVVAVNTRFIGLCLLLRRGCEEDCSDAVFVRARAFQHQCCSKGLVDVLHHQNPCRRRGSCAALQRESRPPNHEPDPQESKSPTTEIAVPASRVWLVPSLFVREVPTLNLMSTGTGPPFSLETVSRALIGALREAA